LVLRPWLAGFEVSDVAERDLGDLAERLARQKSLMSGDDDVRKCRQALENVVLDSRQRPVCEKQRAFFLVHVDSEIPKVFAAFERIDRRARIDQWATRGVYQH
jgi:hypothetical protein